VERPTEGKYTKEVGYRQIQGKHLWEEREEWTRFCCKM